MEQTDVTVDGVPPARVQGGADRPRATEAAGEGVVTLGPDDRLEGKLVIRSGLLVQGSLEGEVITSGDMTVEAGALVKAKVECRNLTVRGRVEGDVSARQRLRLSGSGFLQGSIRVNKLQVEDGATLNGSIEMAASEAKAHR